MLKVVYFLCTVCGTYFSIPIHTQPQSKVSKDSYVIYLLGLLLYHHYLTNFDFLLSHDQTSRYRIWQMMGEKLGLSRLLWMMSDICNVIDGMRVVVKCLGYILIPCFGAGCVWGWRSTGYTLNRAYFFVRKKYTTFSTERIVALRSLNKIFPESYNFTANVNHTHDCNKHRINCVLAFYSSDTSTIIFWFICNSTVASRAVGRIIISNTAQGCIKIQAILSLSSPSSRWIKHTEYFDSFCSNLLQILNQIMKSDEGNEQRRDQTVF